MNARARQITKTRDAIKAAFAELVFVRRYGEIRMTDIAALANVGRSTLYLHYPDKDSILLDNLSPLLDDLAQAPKGGEAIAGIEAALTHIWSHRDRGRIVMFGTTGQKLERALAERILKDMPTQANAIFAANMIAAAIFSVVRTWLKGAASSSASDIAWDICLSSQAIDEVLRR